MNKSFKNTRRYITLIEIMVVMFLIALIMGVLAWNLRGSLDEGRAFKTRAGIEKLESVLEMTTANNPEALNDLGDKWEELVKSSPLVSNPNAIIRDGWGDKYHVSIEDGNIVIKSDKYEDYKKSHPASFSSGN